MEPSVTASPARSLLLPLVLLGGCLCLLNFEILTGEAVPFFRDIGTTQRPGRVLFEKLGRASINPHASFGQPYYGNPNFLLAYPFPRAPRFLGLHLVLHVFLGVCGAALFLSRRVRTPQAAILGGVTFGLSGYAVSSTAFLNASATIAWIPWLLYFLERAREAAGKTWPSVLSVCCAAGTVSLMLLAGEPALAALGFVAAFFSAVTGTGRRVKLIALMLAVTAGVLVISPWLLEVVRSSGFSSRRLRGFSWREFSAAAFHPLRFLETPFPFVFGDSSRLVSGGFWGFAVMQGNQPYLSSLHFGVVSSLLAFLAAARFARREARPWFLVACASLFVALIRWIPGAEAVYQALTPVHALRYPLKAMLVFTVALSVLAALGLDRLLGEPRSEKARVWFAGFLGFGLFLGLAALVAKLFPSLLMKLLLLGWDPAWRSNPEVVLAPILEAVPLRAALSAFFVLAVGVSIKVPPGGSVSRWGLTVLCAGELLLNSFRIIPAVPAAWYEIPSPLVEKAAGLGGRVFEIAGKDLDAVRKGVLGREPFDDVRSVALAQITQGWAISGAPSGLRYAYDQDPDGSYSLLDRMARDLIMSRDWPLRVKWLRAAGVRSIIADEIPAGLGVTPLATEGRFGLPATLYRIDDALPAVRRLSDVRGSASVTEAVHVVESPDFDPETMAVIAGRKPWPGVKAKDPSAFARLVSELADEVTVETDGVHAAYLFIDRTFTPRSVAYVNGQRTAPVAAYIHLTGVAVPAGRSTVRLLLAP